MSVGAGQLLREIAPGLIAGLVDEVDRDYAVGQPEGGLHRVGEAGEDLGARDETIDHDGDIVLDLLLEFGRIGELHGLAVDDGAGVSARRQFAEQIDELAFLLRDHRADHLVAGARFECHELIGDLLHRLALDALIADGAVGDADTGPQ